MRLNMIRFIAVPIFCLLSISTTAQTQTGPFGFDIGSDIDTYDCDKIDAPGKYSCKAKKEHPDFESYGVTYFPETGICWVKGIGRNIESDRYGVSLKSVIEKITGQIESVYGKSTELTDFLSYNALWDDSDEWMMAVKQAERYYMISWESDEGYMPVKNVNKIYIAAQALSSDVGYPVIEFYGENYDQCQKVSDQAGASAF